MLPHLWLVPARRSERVLVKSGRKHEHSVVQLWSLSSNFEGDGNCSGRALGPVPMFAVGIKQFPNTVSPLLIRRTAESFLETLGRNLDDAQTALRSREFDHRLPLDRFQTRTKPARRAFQQCDDRTRAPALAVEKGDETLQEFDQIVPRANLKRNRFDDSDNELVARTLGLRNNDGGLGGAYPENHAGIVADETSRVKRRLWLVLPKCAIEFRRGV